MRRLYLTTAIVWGATSAVAWAQAPLTLPEDRAERRLESREAADAVRATIDERPVLSTPAKIETPADRAAGPVRQDWRYRRHNGRWWYWLPDKSWVVWSDNAWVRYRPANNPGQVTTGYRGPEVTQPEPAAGSYDRAYDSRNAYRRRELMRNRPPATAAAPPAGMLPPPVQGSAIQGGGGQGTGGPIGSPQEAGSVRIGGGSASQSSGARARGNLGTFGTAGGQIGGSGASAETVEREPLRIRP